jgi:hypothetical protein
MERMHMRAESIKGEELKGDIGYRGYARLFMALALALVVVTVLIMSFKPGVENKGDVLLSQALLSEKTGLEIDSQGLASRVIEQKFQIHMEEMDQQMGEIPYVEVWVLNDPFYPLMGPVADLRSNGGNLSSKEWQMLGFPDYEAQAGAPAGGAPAPSQPPSSTPVTTSVPQRVVMVEDIYEIRGIKYATIKVNDHNYDKLKAGSEFADVFKVQEIKDNQTVVVLCGDETYELKVDQLRKI